MGYRAHIIKNYVVEVGDCIGFNYDIEGFSSMLEELEVQHFGDEERTFVEVDRDDLLSLSQEKIASLSKEKQEALMSLKSMAHAPYAVKSGYVRVHWY
ncbi:hypothetical protein [Helicobacter cinaedi]|uniref:hypothetical protein n=1 Tax=Helicobacter cinaedi TaxID=213 RepID=UPI000D7C2DAA|nr:hypothetical protein [Helicobacter cinaedi]